jgi:sugar phosphate isomerase/epimerase
VSSTSPVDGPAAQPPRTRTGLCLAALLANHGAPTPDDLAQALLAAEEAGVGHLSLFAAHAAAAVTPCATTGSTALAEDLVAWLVREHRRAGDLAEKGELEPLAGRLDELGLEVAVLEFATAWAGGEPQAIDEEMTSLCKVATRLRAPRMLALCVEQSVDWPTAARGLARAADVAAEYDIRVCVEFTALFAVGRLEEVVELLRRADRPNLGIVLDTFHWRHQPGGPDVSVLRGIEDRLDFVQVAGATEGTGEDLSANFARALPEDDPKLHGLLVAIAESGARAFVAGEVFDHERLRRLGPRAYALSVTQAVDAAVLGAGLVSQPTFGGARAS